MATFTADPAAPPAALRRTADRIRQRAASLGMAETRVAVRGGSVVVTGRSTGDRLRALGALGRLRFRPVLARQDGGSATPQPSGPAPQGRAAGRPPGADASAPPRTGSTGGPDALPPELLARYRELDCSPGRADGAADQDAEAAVPVLACAPGASSGAPPAKFLLGPAVLTDTDVASAEAVNGTSGGAGWLVQLAFTSSGTAKFTEVTGRLAGNRDPQNQFAVVVDGEVVSAPAVAQALTGGVAQISGGFTGRAARELAARLNSGALPVALTFAGATPVGGR
ncbi:preprotein translocase subunit SecD [Streptomyces zinciresistens K42]|uniref:Preprotein translocase subunit SecD n=1 Tax=Streptomyces zinciresistens K42 TaxID=700597 RepID=G2GL27_9ACTN|nr:hypothetical protein [Streptomyces zinciresistens]EGX55791.1 preprotein translocase subunit SecD [Streptomyces zinciresistens K42]